MRISVKKILTFFMVFFFFHFYLTLKTVFFFNFRFFLAFFSTYLGEVKKI